MKKNILIDMTVLAQGTKTGVYRVAHELVRRLLSDPNFEVSFTLTLEEEFARNGTSLRDQLIHYCAEHAITAPFIDCETDPAFTGIDLYLTPFFKVPDRWARDRRVSKAAVAYDLIPIRFPEFCEDGIIGLVTEFYDHLDDDWLIFSISECTKRDLLAYRPDIPEERIIVTHLGAEEKFAPAPKISSDRKRLERYGIPPESPYVLSVATLEIRKNLTGVLEGFSEYIRQSGDDRTLLVLAGMKGWKLEQLERRIAEDERIKRRVILSGFVDDADLPALYRHATVFVYLSHYEGFGLPPLEAMSCGVPVIASDNSSLPEVIGEGGVMVNATDEQAFSSTLAGLLSDDGGREELAQRALRQAGKFSWTRFGDGVVRALGTLAPDPTPALSIITICYNEKHIRETCESVRQQTFDRFEWIVIDGGSGAETLQALGDYREDMAVFVSEPDNGRYHAMNKGIARSRGRYLLFLNGGDRLHDRDTLRTVFKMSAPLEMSKWLTLKLNAPVVYGEVIAKETGMFPHPLWRTGPQTHDLDFFSGNSLPHQATFIRRDLFERFGAYDDTLHYAADYEWFIRTLAYHGIESQYLPLAVSVYNFEGVSSASAEADAPHIVEINQVYTHYSSPGVDRAWPDRAGKERRPAPTPAAGIRRDGFALDAAFSDRLLGLTCKRLPVTALRDLIKRCQLMLHASPDPIEYSPPRTAEGNGKLSQAAAGLFLARLDRAIRDAGNINEQVRFRRILIHFQERLTQELQQRLTADGGDGQLREASPGDHPLFNFAKRLGPRQPSLGEPEEYLIAQQALRAAGRDRFPKADENRGAAATGGREP